MASTPAFPLNCEEYCTYNFNLTNRNDYFLLQNPQIPYPQLSLSVLKIPTIELGTWLSPRSGNGFTWFQNQIRLNPVVVSWATKLQIIAFSYEGNADIYVSMGELPNMVQHSYSSTNSGTDVLIIPLTPSGIFIIIFFILSLFLILN